MKFKLVDAVEWLKHVPLRYWYACLALVILALAILLSTNWTPKVSSAYDTDGTDTPNVQLQSGTRYGDWSYDCVKLPDQSELCSLNQVIVGKDPNKIISRFSIGRDKITKHISFGAQLPLGLDIPQGVHLTIDQNPQIALVILTCGQNGCVANAQLDGAHVRNLKAGKAFSVSFTFRGADKRAVLVGSTAGLAQALNADDMR